MYGCKNCRRFLKEEEEKKEKEFGFSCGIQQYPIFCVAEKEG